jgi:hypothetical protein
MQKTKLATVLFLLAALIIAFVGYELFLTDSLSSYTKITLTPWCYPPNSVKFDNNSYYIVFFLVDKSIHGAPSLTTPPDPYFQVTTEQTLIIDSNQRFAATEGAKYSFEGLRIVVGSVNVTSHQLVLYVKSTTSNSQPIISPLPAPFISPLPTTYQSSPVPVPSAPPYIVK